MKLPKSIRIGTQDYRVIERSEGEDGGLTDSYAYTLIDANLIVLKKETPPQRKRAFLMHEILHAVIFTFGDHTVKGNETFDDWEHHFIYTLQEPLTLLLKENPDLVAYLQADE